MEDSYEGIKPRESLYQEKLDGILSRELTPENIDTYADDAMDGLAGLIDELRNDPAYKWDFTLNASSKEQEDEMLRQILGVDVAEVLDRIDYMGNDTDDLDEVVQKGRQNEEQRVYIPPDASAPLTAGTEKYEEGEKVSKAKAALFVLENDFGVDLNNPEEFQMSTGVVTERMMRKTSYDIINALKLDRLIVSCDEIGNRTFVFDTKKLAEQGINIDEIKGFTKQEIQQLLDNNPAVGTGLVYSEKGYLAALSEKIKDPTRWIPAF